MASSTPEPRQEIPPTAGLPLRLADLFAAPGKSLATGLSALLGGQPVGMTCSGTVAFILILTALHRRTGRRRVIVPAFTCPLVPLAIAHCGLEVVVCDIAPGFSTVDADHLAQLCDRQTLAVVPTYLGGKVASIGPILEIARAVGAFVVEDAAQALGAEVAGESVGLQGDAGFFSLAAGKGLSIFEGGAWISRDAELRAEIAAVERNVVPSRVGFEACRCLQLAGYGHFYRPDRLRLVYGRPLRRALEAGDLEEAVGDRFSDDIPVHRVSAWRQRVGANALVRLPAFLAAGSARARERRLRLAELPGVQVVDDGPGTRGVWPFLQVVMPSAGLRDTALADLWPAGLGVTRLFIHALPDYGYLHSIVPSTACPHARDFAARMLTVTNSPWLDAASFERIVAALARALAG